VRLLIQIVIAVLFFALGTFQMFAVMAGLKTLFGFGTLASFLLSGLVSYFPFIGTVLGMYGAVTAWGWSWLEAFSLFFGSLIIISVLLIIVSMFEGFRKPRESNASTRKPNSHVRSKKRIYIGNTFLFLGLVWFVGGLIILWSMRDYIAMAYGDASILTIFLVTTGLQEGLNILLAPLIFLENYGVVIGLLLIGYAVKTANKLGTIVGAMLLIGVPVVSATYQTFFTHIF
jgi:hypothetical protein